jgi:excisionase family DNA binding protein
VDEFSVMKKELLGVAEVAKYLGVNQVTVYRWCREGRLPCIKMGKSWRIRSAALDDFLRQREQDPTLAGQLRAFLKMPDSVIGIAQTPELLHRLDTAFFQVAEARGGTMVKFHGGEPAGEDELRDNFERNGLEITRLEEEGRFRFSAETNPLEGREDDLRRVLSEEMDSGRSLWVTFDWMDDIDLGAVLEQQEKLTEFADSRQLVVKTAVMQEVIDEWPPKMRHYAQVLHSGVIWISEAGLSLSRVTPLPPG